MPVCNVAARNTSANASGIPYQADGDNHKDYRPSCRQEGAHGLVAGLSQTTEVGMGFA